MAPHSLKLGAKIPHHRIDKHISLLNCAFEPVRGVARRLSFGTEMQQVPDVPLEQGPVDRLGQV